MTDKIDDKINSLREKGKKKLKQLYNININICDLVFEKYRSQIEAFCPSLQNKQMECIHFLSTNGIFECVFVDLEDNSVRFGINMSNRGGEDGHLDWLRYSNEVSYDENYEQTTKDNFKEVCKQIRKQQYERYQTISNFIADMCAHTKEHNNITDNKKSMDTEFSCVYDDECFHVWNFDMWLSCDGLKYEDRY
jgi:hypothetical protein